MRLVQLRIFTGDPETPGDPVYVAPDNVGSVSFFLADPPAAEVHLKTGPLSHVVDGSAERVAMLLAEGRVDRLPPAPKPTPDYASGYARPAPAARTGPPDPFRPAGAQPGLP